MWLVCLAQLIEGGVWEERMGSDLGARRVNQSPST